MKRSEILIVGAGPAGIAAAVRARERGQGVTVLDDNPEAGGQIWRGARQHTPDARASGWLKNFQNSGAELIAGTRVVGGDPAQRTLQVESADRAFEIGYKHLIIATGARELFLPFPGWTLPNVTGVGGLQALVKSGLPVERKKIVVAGTGPLLLAVAGYLRTRGASVVAVAEQADWNRILRFGVQLLRYPSKLRQAAALLQSAYWTSCWVTAAEGDDRLRRVRLQHLSGMRTLDCDYLAVAYGFWPNVELARYLGCELRENAVKVDEWQQTSVPGIYCAGESAGIGGVDRAIVEGEIAGLVVSGGNTRAQALFPTRSQAWRFAESLEETFAPRPELRGVAKPDTIVCRCEDVTLERLRTADSWRAAKLHTRCGMGPCQGRICGPAVSFLLGWQMESVRVPVFPARISSLISAANRGADSRSEDAADGEDPPRAKFAVTEKDSISPEKGSFL